MTQCVRREGQNQLKWGVVSLLTVTRTQVIFINVLGLSHIFLKRNDHAIVNDMAKLSKD